MDTMFLARLWPIESRMLSHMRYSYVVVVVVVVCVCESMHHVQRGVLNPDKYKDTMSENTEENSLSYS